LQGRQTNGEVNGKQGVEWQMARAVQKLTLLMNNL
jgi:hypothetical protein